MIPKEILKQVRYIEIKTTKLVNEFFGGEYLSVFKGQGMEFANVRQYVYGDDIRAIDWNVTARTGGPHVKEFIEEREMSVVFLVDNSSSHHFGSCEKLKSEVAAELSALLAFAAVKNNDKVGLVMFSDTIEKYVPVQKGRQHVLRVVREVLFNKPYGGKTDIAGAVEFLNKVLTRRSLVVVISDFMDDGFDTPLKILARYHDVIALRVFDPRECELPRVGMISLEDPESGARTVVDTNSRAFRTQFAAARKKQDAQLQEKFLTYGIDTVDINASEPYIKPLMELFNRRAQKKKRS